MSESIDDQDLIDACRSGKTEAFGVLVRRYQDRLYPTVLRLTGCADDAYDLLQETFLRAYSKAQQIPRGKFVLHLGLPDRREPCSQRSTPKTTAVPAR